MKQIVLFSAAILLAFIAAGCTDSATAPTDQQASDELNFSQHSEAQAMMNTAAVNKRNFRAHLNGENEVPSVDTRARGETGFKVSKDGSSISYKLIVANIENVTQAHIHWAPAGENGPVVVWLYPEGPPAQLIEGRFSGILAEGVITEADLVGQLAGEPLETLLDLMRTGDVYVNVHTSQFPPGEVRGQIF